MKGENERKEKKGKEGRKKGKGKKERGERKGEKRERGEKRRGKKNSTAGLEPTTFHSTANCLQLPPEVELHARTNVLNRHIPYFSLISLCYISIFNN